MSHPKKRKFHNDDPYEIYKKIRKPMPKPSRVIDSEREPGKRFDWRDEMDQDSLLEDNEKYG